jgi:hypothetical protein
MNNALDPRISEFKTQEEADAHAHWFRSKVQEALNETEPGHPHDAVMERMKALLELHSKKAA